MPSKYVEYLKCDLTDAEVADAARDLARANARRQSIEQQKKEVDSQLKSEIEAANTVISRLSTLINTGHEYRNIECRVELDTPEPGKKTIVRLDTGEEVAVKAMTDADRQMVMDLHAAAEAVEQEAQEAQQDLGVVDCDPSLASVTSMGGSHQKRRKGKEAAAGDGVT